MCPQAAAEATVAVGVMDLMDRLEARYGRRYRPRVWGRLYREMCAWARRGEWKCPTVCPECSGDQEVTAYRLAANAARRLEQDAPTTSPAWVELLERIDAAAAGTTTLWATDD